MLYSTTLDLFELSILDIINGIVTSKVYHSPPN